MLYCRLSWHDVLLLQVPSMSAQRLLLTGGDSAKPAKAAAAPKENGEAAVPVTASSANADGPASGANGTAEVPGEQEAEETPGQLVELKFRAPRAGKYDLSLYCVSGERLPQTDTPLQSAGCVQDCEKESAGPPERSKPLANLTLQI